MLYRYDSFIIILHCALVTSLQFTQEPSNHIAAELQPTWWHCIARGNPQPIYTWLYNGQLINGRTNYDVIGNGTLHIYRVDASSVGSYQCQAESGEEIITSSPVQLSLATISRTFSTNPSNQNSNLGESVMFECAISSAPAAIITWQLNGQDLEEGRTVTTTIGDTTTRSTLSLDTLRHEHSGQYRCAALNPLLTSAAVYSNPAALTLTGRPGFLITPSPMTVMTGASVNFQCETTGSPVARIEWIDSNSQIVQTSGRFTATQNRLTITAAQQSDAGYYTCKAINEWGENTASALLTITDPSQQVFLTKTPTDQSVAVGGRATFPCEASGSPTPRITWNKIDGSLPLGRVEEPAAGWLRINNVQALDSGVYQCTAINQLDSNSAQAQLIVLEGPSLTITPVDTIAKEGRAAVLQCQADGSPSPSITWTTPVPGLASIEAPGGPFSSVTVTADGMLTVSDVADYHAGIYTCTASNYVGSVSARANLIVQRPPVFTSVSSNKRVVEGGTVFFRCRAVGNPDSQISWHFNSAELQSDAKHSVYGNGDLMISNIEKQQEGVYTCVARNSLGEESHQVDLRVLIPPQFISFPMDQIVELGDSVQLQCVVTGDPQPEIEWVKDGQQIVLETNVTVDETSISIFGIAAANLGAYTCIASNEAGTNQMTAMILTPDVPVFSTPPVNTTANLTDTVIIPCRTSAREAPSVTWYIATNNGDEGQEIGLGNLPTRIQGASSFVTMEGDLEFTAVRANDEGWYLCVAENSIGIVDGTAYLSVNVPPSITNTNSPLVANEGDLYLLLECTVEGRPSPQIKWLLPSGDPISDEPSEYNAQPGTGYLVVYSPNVESHDGDFTCMASNLLGSAEGIITVIIRGPPLLRHFLITHTDASITILCVTKGSPPPTIVWLQDSFQIIGNSLIGHSINGEGALVITDLDAVHHHVYYCQASNDMGMITSSIQLPGTPDMPRITDVTATSVDLAWTKPETSSDLDVTAYRLQYLEFGKTTYRDVGTDVTATVYRITELRPYTGYMFRVQAVNSLGTGDFSLPTQVVLTAESVPSEPLSVQANPLETEIYVTWSQPDALNAHPDNIAYEIAYLTLGSRIDQATVLYKRHNDGPLAVQLTHLKVETTYIIRIRAVNTMLNQRSQYVSINATTQYQAPTTAVQRFAVSTNGSGYLFITWQAVHDRTFHAYHISYGYQHPNTTFTTIDIADMAVDSTLIDDLEQNADYVVWMTYSNKGGHSPNTTLLRLTIKNAPTSRPASQGANLPFSVGVLVAIAIGCIVAVLLLIIIILVIRQRHSGGIGGRWHTRLNPDALWIHKRNSFSDGMSIDSHGDSSGEGSTGQRTGTYDVAVVNQSFQRDDAAMSTLSEYDLGGEYEHANKDKKKRKRGLRDVIFKSRENPDVVLLSKAVIGDHSSLPVMLSQPSTSDAPQRSIAEMLRPYQDEASAEEPSQTEVSVISSVSTEFPIFPNADDTRKLATELQVDSKQMRKMARKAERDHKKKMKQDTWQRRETRKPSLSDRLGMISGKSKKMPVQTSYEQGDFMLTTDRQRENVLII